MEKIKKNLKFNQKIAMLANILYLVVGLILLLLAVAIKISPVITILLVGMGIFSLIASVILLVIPRQFYNSELSEEILRRLKNE